jgi:hypothetical protein
LDDLSVTRTLEAWVEHRRFQRLAREGANAGAVALGCGAVALSGWLWVPELLFVPPLFGLGALVALGVGVWRARSRFDLEALADEIDAESGSDGLMRTALAVEGRRAVGSDALQAMVRGRAVEVLPHLEAYGRPPFELPAVAILGGALALLLAVLAVALAIVLPALVDANAPTSLPIVPVVLHDGDRSDLIEAIEDLARLAREPGAEPEARAEVDKARGHVQEALSHLSDARRAAAELDVARAALERAQRGSFRSASALEAARSEAVADALADALQRGDAGIARRMADEILRRIESERSEGELRRLGRSLADRPRPAGAAGLAMERAGEKLGAGDQGGALAALADLMAALGEPVRVPDRPAELQQAAEAIERARQRALARLDQAEREASGEPAGRSEGAPEPVGAPPSAPSDGEVPFPIDAPQRGGGGDGGGGGAEGGTQDLIEGGTPTTGAPEVAADAPDTARTVGDGLGGRTVAGAGEATSDDEMLGDANAATGTPRGAGQPSEGPGEGAAGAGGAGGARRGAGEGAGSGASLDFPLLELAEGVVPAEWIRSQWAEAPDTMGELMRGVEAGGRSSLAWSEVHARYRALAESASRRDAVPLSRRQYIQNYFEAIRPELPPETP